MEATADRRARVSQRVGQVGRLHDEAAGAGRGAEERQGVAVKQGRIAQRGDDRRGRLAEKSLERRGVLGIGARQRQQ